MNISFFEKKLNDLTGNATAEELKKILHAKKKFEPFFEKISQLLYEKLPNKDQERFVIWFLKRWLKIDRVPQEELANYKSEVHRVASYPYKKELFDNKEYKLLILEPQGYKGALLTYSWNIGIHDFLFNQYQHDDFCILPNSTIIDAGAFVGDTALLFFELTNGNCDIHSFEVLDENLKLLKHNLAENKISEKVNLCESALSNISGDYVFINEHTLQGATSIFGDEKGKRVKTITIDDYVKSNGVKKVDLIKMDIEGAERIALKGAIKTIKKDLPQLAICIYHLWDDVFEIPQIIQETGVPYSFGFKWVELNNGWEAVLFATPVP